MRQRLWPLIAVLALVVGRAGGEPFEPIEPGAIPDGPGLFTGKEGALVIAPGSSPDGDNSPTSRQNGERQRQREEGCGLC